MVYVCQWVRSKGGPKVFFRGTEVNAVKDSNPNITNNRAVGFDTPPRPLHNRYALTNTCVRWRIAVKCSCCVYDGCTSVAAMIKPLQKCNHHVAVSEVKPPPGSGSGQKKSVRTSKNLWVEQNFKGNTAGVVIALFPKKSFWCPLGSNPLKYKH